MDSTPHGSDEKNLESPYHIRAPAESISSKKYLRQRVSGLPEFSVPGLSMISMSAI